MATTSPDNLRTPNPGDPYNLVPDLATLAQDVQNALNNKQSNVFKGTAAQRVAFLSTAAVGMLWQDTDGIGMLWKKVGVAWVPAVWRWSGTTAQMNAFTQAPNGFGWFNTTDNLDYVRLAGVWTYVRKSGKNTFTSVAMAGAVAPVHWSNKLTIPFGMTFAAPPTISLAISSGDLILWPTAINVFNDKIEFRVSSTNNVTVPTLVAHWTIFPI